MRLKNYLTELSYTKNIGFEEMVKFYEIADEAEIKEMNKYIENSDWNGFKALIKRILGVILK